MPQFLYTLLTSNIFWYFSGIWILIVLANKGKRNRFLNQLNILLVKPSVFEEDSDPESVPFYPRILLERIASGFKNTTDNLTRSAAEFLAQSSSRLIYIVSNPDKPRIIFGYLLSLIIVIFFLFSDAIAIINTLATLGLLDVSKIWSPLTNYSIAIVAGSLFSVVVAVFVLSEIYSNKSEFSDWDSIEEGWRRTAKLISVLLVFLGFLAVVALGLQRLLVFGHFLQQEFVVNAFIYSVIFIIIPVNTTFVTALVWTEGMKGMVPLFAAFLALGAVLFRFLDFIILIISYISLFAFDVAYRLVLMIFFTASFVLITPIDLITSLIISPFSNDEFQSKNKKS